MSEDVIVYGVLVLLATGVLVWALAVVAVLVGLVRGLVWLVCRIVRAVAGRPAPTPSAEARCPVCSGTLESCRCGSERPGNPRRVGVEYTGGEVR